MTPAQVRSVGVGQHYAELLAKHETSERAVKRVLGGQAK